MSEHKTQQTEVAPLPRNPEARYFDIAGAAEYARSIGLNGVTPWTIRSAINSGRLSHIRQGKKFYVSQAAIEAWLAKAERRVRA